MKNKDPSLFTRDLFLASQSRKTLLTAVVHTFVNNDDVHVADGPCRAYMQNFTFICLLEAKIVLGPVRFCGSGDKGHDEGEKQLVETEEISATVHCSRERKKYHDIYVR